MWLHEMAVAARAFDDAVDPFVGTDGAAKTWGKGQKAKVSDGHSTKCFWIRCVAFFLLKGQLPSNQPNIGGNDLGWWQKWAGVRFNQVYGGQHLFEQAANPQFARKQQQLQYGCSNYGFNMIIHPRVCVFA